VYECVKEQPPQREQNLCKWNGIFGAESPVTVIEIGHDLRPRKREEHVVGDVLGV
jgi:hypothetical protein